MESAGIRDFPIGDIGIIGKNTIIDDRILQFENSTGIVLKITIGFILNVCVRRINDSNFCSIKKSCIKGSQYSYIARIDEINISLIGESCTTGSK